MIQMPTFQPAIIPEGIDPALKSYLQGLNARISEYGIAVQQAVNGVIDRKHAPILIPAVTIDASHAKLSITAASAATIFNNLALQNTASSTSSSLQTAVNYTGRGVLTKCLAIEKTSAGTTAYNAAVKITIDGNVVYNDTAALARQSQMRVILGNQLVTGTDLISVTHASIGLPFNQSCKIEYSSSDGTTTTTVAWNISKKL